MRSHFAGDAADVHDAAARALLDHLLRGKLRAEEGALEIYLQHFLVLLLGGVKDVRAGFDAGVVDHHVEPAELGDGGVDELLQVGDFADVGVDAAIAERRAERAVPSSAGGAS